MNQIIVGMGEALWDVLPEGKKIGGAPANFAYHVSQFGFDSRVVSAIGDDKLGNEILENFDGKNLKYQIEKVPYPTGTVQVELDPNGVPMYDIKEGVAWDNIPFTPALEELAKNTTPNLVYGIGASFAWKGIDVNVHFQGAGKSTFPIYGKCVYAFSESDWGNIFKDMISDRWVDSETAAKLGLHANENPNATYPRLTYGENKNNQQTSTYWMRDGRYIRLKNLDIGYTLPKSIVNKLHFNNIRIYIAGSNLITWSKFKTWDPETGNPRGEAYPLTKSVTMGLSVNL